MNAVIVSILAVISSYVGPGEKPVKFPVQLDRTGFEAGVFDVGLGYVSGQPTADTLRQLAKEGFTTVVSVRSKQEMDDRNQVPFDEAALLGELNVDYYNVPFGGDGPKQVKEFADIVNKAKGKVLLHCTIAWRATYVWMAYLIIDRKYSIDEAWKAGMQMSVTVDRSALMLDADVSYTAVPRTPGGRKPKEGIISKPGSKLTITSPQVIYPPVPSSRSFELWDLGSILIGNQPNEAQFRDLASRGVKTVISIRAPEVVSRSAKGGFDEEAFVKGLGLAYVEVPLSLSWRSFTPANLDKVADAFEKADGRMFFHDTSAVRVTQIIVPYLVKYQGMSLDEATKVGESISQDKMLTGLLGVDLQHNLKPKH
jgi:protein tyrosine phosphatase (PTP) superfamily phosphohydrolase (DUF442 family)